MAAVTIYINGQEIQAEDGQTVLQAAQAAGVHIPTLCHHAAVANWGGCRMCLIEVEPRGQLQPSCTFPVSQGLRVQTDSEKVVRSRKFVLNLLFSERGHYCMYCAASGSCELQNLAYEYGLDHWLYGRPNEAREVDASRPYFTMDHNRCILCRRCIRGCDEISAVHVLGIGQRGAKSIVVADLDAPFGQSSCISCGTCLQLCPVGALVDRKSAYMGRDEELASVKTACFECGVGCGPVARVRSDRLVRIEGDWDAEPNHGLLCKMGRFEPLRVTARRVHSPMRRVGGRLLPCSWEEAFAAIAPRLAGNTVALVSSRATDEEIAAFLETFAFGRVALYGGAAAPAIPGRSCGLGDVERASAIVALGVELDDEHEVVASFVRRALDRGANLFLLGSHAAKLSGLATQEGDLSAASGLTEALTGESSVVVLFGPAATAASLETLAGLSNARFLPLHSGTNTAAALARGVPCQAPSEADTLYVYAADDPAASVPAIKAGFVVAHATYHSALTESADLVLPALHWTEKLGHLTNIEGRTVEARRAVAIPAALREDRDVFASLRSVRVQA